MSQSYSTQMLNADVISVIANVAANESKAIEVASHIASKISDGELKLVELVICLRDFIISPDHTERKNALCSLSVILGQLPKQILSKNDVSVILDFYLGKFDDTSCLEEILHGISSIIEMKCFYCNQIASVLNPLKDDYQPTQHLAATRYYAFLILDHVLERFQTDILKNVNMNNLFVETFLSVAAGEKDPRNLLISFQLNSKISGTLNEISHFKEDLFDTLFCYFPITFKPPKNDPYKISNDDLKLALRNAISSNVLYEEDAFGNLVDKMTASSPTVKNDTLLTMKACIEKFGGEACFKNWMPIWNALKFEIMQGSDVDGSNAGSTLIEFDNYEDSLRVLTALSAQLIGYKEGAFDKFRNHIFDELKPNFRYEKDLKQSCAVLSAMSKVNTVTFEKILSDVLVLFFQDVNDLNLNKQKLLMLNLSSFFDAYIEVFRENNNTQVSKKVPGNKLAEYKDEILMLLSKGLKGSSESEVTLKTLSVVQMTKLVKMPGYLIEEEVSLIVQYLTETILTNDNKNLYFVCLEGLKATSETWESTVVEYSLDQMLDLLKNKGLSASLLSGKEAINAEKVLKVLLDFTSSRHKLVVESIIGVTERIFENSKDRGEAESCFMLLSCLYSLLDSNQEILVEDVAAKLKSTVEAKLLAAAMEESIYNDDHNLTLISSVLFFINVHTSRSTHQAEINRCQHMFVKDSKVMEIPKRSVMLFVKLLSAFDKTCKLDVENLVSKCVNLLGTQGLEISEFEKLSYLELLAVLTNKWCSDEFLKTVLDIENCSINNLQIIAWCTKGLAMKNSPLAVKFIKELIRLLADVAIGSQVASLFEIFVMDIPTLDRIKGIPWDNNVMLLYKQKLFGDVAPQLVIAYGETDDMLVKANYLMALSYVLKNTPNRITVNYIPKLLALLLQAVTLDNSEVRFSALSTIRGTVEQAPQFITEHVHSLIPLLIDLLRPTKHNSYMVRLTALGILRDFTEHVPLNYLLPFKDDIIAGLGVALDDKKRNVRKLCTDARQTYFELGQVPFD
ncbi:LANO_0H07822g1_1 [Lachancea nothofagi CBS 11611]|uniref:MMS19 nucleotide excision repair protein n=1 Tax=Lachancea nothofagi CBS 11611 TaxID=1266666 RepID=A0A1G4KLJ1_9SACH|nr:LANO_0H07822g1_1 [Lachancea nothofagi CBS 11611]